MQVYNVGDLREIMFGFKCDWLFQHRTMNVLNIEYIRYCDTYIQCIKVLCACVVFRYVGDQGRPLGGTNSSTELSLPNFGAQFFLYV